jgi:hypothetical protein
MVFTMSPSGARLARGSVACSTAARCCGRRTVVRHRSAGYLTCAGADERAADCARYAGALT